ncbi:unnamed protein product, partial [Rotaria magnacalcarata]
SCSGNIIKDKAPSINNDVLGRIFPPPYRR